MAKVFLAQKVLQTDLTMILSGPELYRKLEFQFKVLTFLLSCLGKTQISLQIFESPLSRHAECYCPISEHSMSIFEVRGGHVPSVLAISSYEFEPPTFGSDDRCFTD